VELEQASSIRRGLDLPTSKLELGSSIRCGPRSVGLDPSRCSLRTDLRVETRRDGGGWRRGAVGGGGGGGVQLGQQLRCGTPRNGRRGGVPAFCSDRCGRCWSRNSGLRCPILQMQRRLHTLLEIV
jgi:hypothetical protein